jgi:hypothetical protein
MMAIGSAAKIEIAFITPSLALRVSNSFNLVALVVNARGGSVPCEIIHAAQC